MNSIKLRTYLRFQSYIFVEVHIYEKKIAQGLLAFLPCGYVLHFNNFEVTLNSRPLHIILFTEIRT